MRVADRVFYFHADANAVGGFVTHPQLDASTFKDFHITESQALGFRADFFNVLNMTSLQNPNNDSSSSTFGQITGVRSPARQIQFSAHYQF